MTLQWWKECMDRGYVPGWVRGRLCYQENSGRETGVALAGRGE